MFFLGGGRGKGENEVRGNSLKNVSVCIYLLPIDDFATGTSDFFFTPVFLLHQNFRGIPENLGVAGGGGTSPCFHFRHPSVFLIV